jgi:hypothetical protein
MKVHDVCILCLKTCKQPHLEWDDKQLEKRFCPNFDAPRSKLSIETLKKLLAYFDELGENFGEELAFLQNLEKVYIPCSKCRHMIAPDELYRVIQDEPVCQGCVET